MIHLLIVDDETASRKVIKAFLDFEVLGITRVSEASNGQEAVDLIRSGPVPQIVITDMNMPIMNGVQLLDFLSDCHPEIKVLIVSGYFDFDYTHAAITAGAQDYLLKPIEADKLRSAAQACVDTIHREAQQQSVTVEHSLLLDTETYKSILKITERMRVALDSQSDEQVFATLDSIQQILRKSAYRENAERFACHLLANILYYHCVAYDCDLSDSPTQKVEDTDTFAALEALYRTTLHRIQIEKQDIHVDVALEKIKAYIDANYHLPLRIESIAASFFISKEYMSTMFRKKYGITMSTYILQLKMEESIRLLKNTEIPIASVAQMMGYEDPAYFNRVFKKYTGDSPGRYRGREE